MSEISQPAKARLRDLRPKRGNGAIDWVFRSILAAFVLFVLGIMIFTWMFSQREYWATDPTLPSVFVMFSKVINGSTVGVICVFVAVVISAAAILVWYFRDKHELLMARVDVLESKQDGVKASAQQVMLRQDEIIYQQVAILEELRLLMIRVTSWDTEEDERQAQGSTRPRRKRNRSKRPMNGQTEQGGNGQIIPLLHSDNGHAEPPLPDNLVQLPSQDTLRAAARLASRVIRAAEDNSEDKN